MSKARHHPLGIRRTPDEEREAFIAGTIQPLKANGQTSQGNAEPESAEGKRVGVDIQPETSNARPLHVQGQPSTGNTQTPEVNGQPPKARRRGMVDRADGKRLAQFTVYLEPEDGMRLKRHCLEAGLVVSEECARVLSAWIRTLPKG